jgi:hypothetical protein
LLRESRQGSGGGSFQPEQCAHFAAFHRLPSTATRVVDQRQSRGYIGQFTPDGNLFVGGCGSCKGVQCCIVSNLLCVLCCLTVAIALTYAAGAAPICSWPGSAPGPGLTTTLSCWE